jgi:hypothetical protein
MCNTYGTKYIPDKRHVLLNKHLQLRGLSSIEKDGNLMTNSKQVEAMAHF